MMSATAIAGGGSRWGIGWCCVGIEFGKDQFVHGTIDLNNYINPTDYKTLDYHYYWPIYTHLLLFGNL